MFHFPANSNVSREVPENQIVYRLDLDGNFTFLNRAGERITGYSCEEACRMNIAEVVAPEFASYVRRQLTRPHRERFGVVYEIEIFNRDGQRLTLETSAHFVVRDNKYVGIQGIAVLTATTGSAAARRMRCLDAKFEFGPVRDRDARGLV